MSELRAAVIEVPSVGPRAVEADVARRLFEWRDPDPAVLDRLGRKRRDLLHSDVGAGQLGHRIVAVADEDSFVELLGTADRDHIVVDGSGAGQAFEAGVRLVDELVQQDPAQALLRPGVLREQRSLDDLGEVAQREDGPVQVGEVALEERRFCRTELGLSHGP